MPLWTGIGDLMPAQPRSRAVPHLGRWEQLRTLAAQAGSLVPVGRGGEHRAIALANRALGGRPFLDDYGLLDEAKSLGVLPETW